MRDPRITSSRSLVESLRIVIQVLIVDVIDLGGSAIADFIGAILPVQRAHRRVQVDAAALQLIDLLECLASRNDRICGPCGPGQTVGSRTCRDRRPQRRVRGSNARSTTRPIASRPVDGPSKGNTRYGPGTDAVNRERLAEVLVVAGRHAELAADVDQPAQAEDGVHHEPAEGQLGALRTRPGADRWRAPPAWSGWRGSCALPCGRTAAWPCDTCAPPAPAAGRRAPVELKDAAVERLERIVTASFLGERGRRPAAGPREAPARSLSAPRPSRGASRPGRATMLDKHGLLPTARCR